MPLLLVAGAAILRLTSLDLVRFQADEATQLAAAATVAEDGRWPLFGTRTSLGTFNGAFSLYLMTVPLLISRSPVVASAFVALLNILALIVCYRFTRRYFGLWEAVVATFLYGVSFWAVYYSRWLVMEAAMPLFTILFVESLFAAVVGGRSWALTMAFLWLALLLQLQFSALPFGLVLLLALFLGRVRAKVLAAGAALFALVWLPYFFAEATYGWPNLRNFLRSTGGTAGLDLTPFRYLVHLLFSSGYSTSLGPPQGELLTLPSWDGVLVQGWSIAFYASMGYLLVASWRREARRRWVLLLLMLLMPSLFYVSRSRPLYVHYFIMLYPILFIVLGVGLVGIGKLWVRKVGRGTGRIVLPLALGLFLAATVFSQLYALISFRRWIDGEATVPLYGVPAKYLFQSVGRARELSQAMGGGPVFVAVGGEVASVFRYLAKGNFDARLVDPAQALVFSTEGSFLYLLPFSKSPDSSSIENSFPTRWVEEGQYPGGQEGYAIYRLDSGDVPRPPKSGHGVGQLAWKLANGLRLESYALDDRVGAGESFQLTLYWRVEKVPQEGAGDYRFFTHLVDNRYRTWGQLDSLGYQDWHSGDVVISWHRIPVAEDAPTGRYWVSLGMYQWKSRERVAMTNERGEETTALKLGPVKVRRPQIVSTPRKWLNLEFEEGILLFGYDLDEEALRPGGLLKLRLYWFSPRQPLVKDYTVFLHLRRQDGSLVAQKDEPPGEGLYPTSFWGSEELVMDEHRLSLPADMEGGTYRLDLGLYELTSMERLKVSLPGGWGDTVSVEIDIPPR
ncbi:MAG: hypothetical protein HYU86_09580 [Chloroflexi bacterium]|nr:hypothetical protein [Chloroflexota bacterium]